MIAFAVLVGCFAILSRDRDRLQKAYDGMLKENQKLIELNYENLKKIRTNGIDNPIYKTHPEIVVYVQKHEHDYLIQNPLYEPNNHK